MKSSIVINVCCLGLLTACFVGILTIPESNYEGIVRRQTTLEKSVRDLAQSVDKEINSRAQFLGSIERNLALLRERYETLSERSARNAAAIDNLIDILNGIQAQENRPQLQDWTIGELYQQRTTDTIDLKRLLPEPVYEKSRVRMDPLLLAQNDFEYFLSVAAGCALIPSLDMLSEKQKARLEEIYSFHKTTIDLLQSKRYTMIADIAREADEAKRYIDVERGNPDAVHRAQQELRSQTSGTGVMHNVDMPNLNVSRVYFLPYEEYTELTEFYDEARNAVDHAIRDMYLAIAED